MPAEWISLLHFRQHSPQWGALFSIFLNIYIYIYIYIWEGNPVDGMLTLRIWFRVRCSFNFQGIWAACPLPFCLMSWEPMKQVRYSLVSPTTSTTHFLMHPERVPYDLHHCHHIPDLCHEMCLSVWSILTGLPKTPGTIHEWFACWADGDSDACMLTWMVW